MLKAAQVGASGYMCTCCIEKHYTTSLVNKMKQCLCLRVCFTLFYAGFIFFSSSFSGQSDSFRLPELWTVKHAEALVSFEKKKDPSFRSPDLYTLAG